jgi:hypothetical protein
MDMENTQAGDDPRAGSVARFGLIDRNTREVSSHLGAILYVCHQLPWTSVGREALRPHERGPESAGRRARRRWRTGRAPAVAREYNRTAFT